MSRIATARLESVSCYSQSKCYEVDKLERETPEEFEKRTWRNRLHVDGDGHVMIPPTAFKNSLSEAVKFTPRKGPTGGKSTWTKNFEAGILVVDPLILPEYAEEVPCERLFVPSDGRRGGGKRVWKYFPLIREWSGTVKYYVLDNSITREIFELYLQECGKFIGIGRFRPRNNGFYGRFKVISVDWEETI